MSEKKRKPPTVITIGAAYGNVKVLALSEHQRDNGPRNYRVQCLRCGRIYDTTAQQFLLRPSGCPECRKKDRQKELLDRYKKYVGMDFGKLTRVCDIISVLKQRTTHWLWVRYLSVLSKHYWKQQIFWSDGYFACSIGEVSSATIQRYIESQG